LSAFGLGIRNLSVGENIRLFSSSLFRDHQIVLSAHSTLCCADCVGSEAQESVQ